MPDPSLTVGELFKAKAVTNDQINAAVDAYLADRQTGEFEIAPVCLIYLAIAIEAHPQSRKPLADPDSSKALRRTMVRPATLLA